MLPRLQATKLMLTDSIVDVFAAYQAARPIELAHSIQTSAEEMKDDGLAVDMIREVGGAVAVAEAGALLGQRGVVAAGAYAGLKVLAQHVMQYAQGEGRPSLDVYNLHYLEREQFIKNENLGGSEAKCKERLKKLQTLFDLTCLYQEIKGTRFGLKLGFIRIGEQQRDDKVIDDVKYFVNILIGRKLQLAAKARSEKEYQGHLEHLARFLESISKMPCVTQSNSDDTKYISLRKIINLVKKDLLDRTITSEDGISEPELVEGVNEGLKKINKEVGGVLGEVAKRFTCFISPRRQIDFLDVLRVPQLDGVGNFSAFEDASSYEALLLEILYKNVAVDDGKLEKLVDEFIAFSQVGKLSKENKGAIKAAFKDLIDAKNKLFQLNLELEKLLESIQSNKDSIKKLAQSLMFLLKEIKLSQSILIEKFRQVESVFRPLQKLSKNTKFKDNFTAYSSDRLDVSLEIIRETKNKLKQCEVRFASVDGYSPPFINEFLEKVKALGFVAPKDLSGIKPKDPEGDSMEEILRDFVEVSKEELEKLAKFSSENEGDVRRQLVQAKQDISNIEIQLKGEKEKVKESEDSLKKVQEENLQLKQQLHSANNNNILLFYKTEFELFVKDYVRNNLSCSRFFSRHGDYGLLVADEILKRFNKMVNEIDLTDVKDVNKFFEDKFVKFLKDNHEILDGNYHPHSLKTYLLAYHQYLAANKPQIFGSAVKHYHHNQYVVKRQDVKKQYLTLVGHPDKVERSAPVIRQ